MPTRLVWTLLGSGLFVAAALAAEPIQTSRMASVPGIVQYRTPDGTSYSALVLPAPALPAMSAEVRDHVLIVDTSASQCGSFRTRSLALAGIVCRALPTGDRVQLIAADVAAESLTAGFVAADSAELKAAFATLEDRVPLGSSNIEPALRLALAAPSKSRSRSVLYVGDGFSTAQLSNMPALG
ncbi:MAG: hypothetical protein V4719_11965, partial [Planctomycetota bacterium]